MSDFSTPPAPTPVKDPNTTLKYAAIGFFAAVAVFLVFMLVSQSNSTDSAKTEDTVATMPAATQAPVQSINKYDSYYEHVLNNSGQANTASKSDVIEFGDLVCQSLDSGKSVLAITSVIANASGSTSDMELGAAVIYGAIKYLCPEYDPMLQAYLAN